MKIYWFWPAVLFFILNIYVQGLKSLPFGSYKTVKDCVNTTVYDKSTQTFYKKPCIKRLPSDMYPDGAEHPCYRKCDKQPMICFYHFHVEWYASMSKACFDCPFNTKDCDRTDCVMADGVNRTITVVNRKLPGPSIHVCRDDKIVVKVTNDLLASGTTIHWHGMKQLTTPFMDGVPFVTQCPIQPEGEFVYEFYAEQAGTFFWHSHVGLQRGDGVSGALVIRQKRVYDNYRHITDLPEHTIQVFDWTKELSTSMYTGHYHSAVEMAPSALLINGRGRFTRTIGDRTVITKPAVFEVTQNFKYRFRFINAQFYFCPVELSIDGHNITIISSDGNDLEPVSAQSLVAYAGERFDFIVHANQTKDDFSKRNYWIKIRGIMNCVNYNHVRQVGILHYHGSEDREPRYGLTWDDRKFNDMSVNIENQGEEQEITKTISKLRSYKKDKYTFKKVPDYQFFVSYDLHVKNNPYFNKHPFYDHKSVAKEFSVPMPQLNHISMMLPSSPLLVSRPSTRTFCNKSSVQLENCHNNFCKCPHVLSVALNSLVEVVIIDEGRDFDANHPFHLHGHSFRVVGQKRLGRSTTAEIVMELDRKGQIFRNLDNPPVKDTVTVPDGGYTVIRFKADNPGYWLFHCHIEFHAEVGMALVFKVGDHDDMVPVPNNFPTCGDYLNSDADAFVIDMPTDEKLNSFEVV